MKKLPVIFCLLIFITVQVKAQKEMLFKMQYLPNHNYSSTTKMDMNMQMDISGDTASVNKMKASGQRVPMIMQIQSTSKLDTKTGNLSSNNDIPLVMSVTPLSTKITMNGKETNVPVLNNSKKFYAKYTKENKLEIDSVSGIKVNDSVKNVVMKMVKNMQANIVFPDKAMKVGDTFLQTIPIDMPVAGMNLKLLGKTTYKLIDIEANKAYFDVNMVITMDMTGKGMMMDITGGGEGKMIFDMVNSYPSIVHNSMKMIYSMQMPQSKKMKMDGKMNMLMDMQTTVTAVN
ncbi:hypothetical protein KXQ82_11795 [Mucilaginibacter sp. HMF5004]|uniref:hypothetical protein n=1 Tax=Mucilaginibacter rivuli TaxID=2857527 RepID=UPI001C5FAD62|nr:hypothetical protein [Mucilaginibacter rivuli]MBW4890408.1 hypothetical protein [Mucilaginibacter rivuli]